MDINYLINMYENELQTLKDDFGANLTSEIANVKARTEALAIQRFIANLKNLPNELKGVSNNEQKQEFCEHIPVELLDKELNYILDYCPKCMQILTK